MSHSSQCFFYHSCQCSITALNVLCITALSVISVTALSVLSVTALNVLSVTALSVLSVTALNVLSIAAVNVLSQPSALNVLSITALNVLSICEADREKVERMTKGQGSNKHWATERMKRLQFSNFRQICKLTERTDASVYAKSLTEMVPQIKVPSISHGNKYEAVVLKKSAEHMGKNKSK